MERRDEMRVEGEPSKPFRIYWTAVNDEPYECEAEYDALEDALRHKRRIDRHYKVCVRGRWLTWKEFEKLAED